MIIWIEAEDCSRHLARRSAERRRIEEGCALVPPRQFIRTSGGLEMHLKHLPIQTFEVCGGFAPQTLVLRGM